ncbi:hypothetical protein K1719_032817 [Acacia pycnantha]|nr:hypothetical protein K1719_032817 [Acacia pycnantha]
MPHFSFSKQKTSDLSSLVFNFCFSIFSHPLYFSYFIFFSPYILKLVSFLSPLFITTTLLLLALFTVSPNYFVLDTNDDSESKLGFLLSNFQTLVLWLHSKSNQKDEESGYLEEFEAYLVMFQASIFQALEAKPEENENSPQCLEEADDPVENNVSVSEVKSLESLFHESEDFEDLGNQKEAKASGEMNVLENLFREDEEFEGLAHQKESKSADSEEVTKGKMESDTKMDDGEGEKKVLEESEEMKGRIIGMRSGIKVMSSKSQRLLEASLGSPENNWIYSESNHLGSFGSMRKEKEWRRTLACKLFEERHNNSSNLISNNNINESESEGMDSLWETYETQSNKPKNKNDKKKKTTTKTVLEKSNTKKSTESKYYDPEDEDDEEEEEEEEGIKLCCLQALKFSAGKMNLGMGKPNLMKISKAFKGIGWLHHHVGKHGKKG